MRDFREREDVVRAWVQFLNNGEESFRSIRSAHPDPVKGAHSRTSPTSTPSNFRCTLLEIGCMLAELGKTSSTRVEILVKRCTRRRKSSEASFAVIAREYRGMSEEACQTLYHEAVEFLFVHLFAAGFNKSPFTEEPIMSIREETACAAERAGEICALTEVA